MRAGFASRGLDFCVRGFERLLPLLLESQQRTCTSHFLQTTSRSPVAPAMGNNMSNDVWMSTYSAWERTYVTQAHNGSTVCPVFAAVHEDLGAYNQVPLHTGAKIPLLEVHGVWNVKKLELSMGGSTSAPGTLKFRKSCSPGALHPGREQCVTFDVPKGATTVDLSSHRALFVAYADALVDLEATLVDLPGVDAPTLSSTFERTPDNQTATVRCMKFTPDGKMEEIVKTTTVKNLPAAILDPFGDDAVAPHAN